MAAPSNVVPFPPTRILADQIDRASDAVPDVREVLNLAEAFEIDPPSMDLQAQVEEAVAGYVEANIPPERGARREAALRAILDEFVERARAAAEVSQEAWAAAEQAHARLSDEQQRRGDADLEVLQRCLDKLTHDAARYRALPPCGRGTRGCSGSGDGAPG
ncbi:hypothetical protein GXW71_10130 [Roseomonas hellenica]|uniref:Uncharacterized protein n=1 Tax=Plastoroseomonas hellenica TaxID=2687306 RepID=A0ABS5EWN0_9PROT|nr:hypothetical protein [Plastoroseomonas hellenica]MBR0664709.1 hypothetical protein [Plastoroseomonas hellenica]